MIAASFFTSAAGLLFATQAALALPSLNPSAVDLTNAKIPLPADPTPLVAPTGVPSYVVIGFGVQNYTCGTAGTYTSAGAVAQLLDFSYVAARSDFPSTSAKITTSTFNTWSSAPSSATIQNVIAGKAKIPFAAPVSNAPVIGQHYFVPNPTGAAGVSPKWDFTSKKGPTAFVIGARDAGLKATNPADVDLLQLHNVQGSLAATIYRVETRGGQPPATCATGSADISVKYVSQYWFYQ